MAPQLSMNPPSGEQPAFGGGMAPPPAGSDGGGLFGLAARTPKFEPELASQSQSLFMPKRKDEPSAEPEQAPETPAAQEPPPGLPTLPPAYERAAEPPAPEPMPAPPLPERPSPERPMPDRPQVERQMPERPQVERQMPEPMPPLPDRPQAEPQMPEQPMPQRPAAAYDPSREHQAFAEPAPLLDGPPAESTHEAMPPVERRHPAPPRPDETQVAMSPRFDQREEPSAGTQPRNEFEQYAPPQQQFGAAPSDARSANPYDRGQQDQQQGAAYGEAAYAPLAPQMEPDQSRWSQPQEQPQGRPYDQPYGQQSYDQQSYDQPYGQPQDGSQDQFGQPYGDPYGQNVYTDATLVGQPPVGAGNGPGAGPNTPAPPPMAPQGYDPYGHGYDAHYEPPRRGDGQGKTIAGIDLKRWGLIALVLAVVVAIIAFVIGLLNNNDDAKAQTGAGQGAGTTAAGGAAAQAKKIDALIQTSAKDKAAIGAAQADLEACENIDEAIKTFEDAAASRESLATKVAKVDTAVLPGSQKVVKNLESAWMTSHNADLAFAAWGEKRKVNDAGECVGGKGKLEKATTLSLASHDPKKAAAKAWGPIAEEHGLDSVEWRKL